MSQRQVRYVRDSAGVPGAPVGPLGTTASGVNGGFAVDIYTITVDTNTDGADYEFQLEGASGALNSLVAVGSTSATLTAEAILAVIRSNVDVSGAWTGTAAAGVVTIVGKDVRSLTATDSDAKITIASVQSASTGGANIGYGLAVEEDSNGGYHAANNTGTFIGISVRQNSGFTAAFDNTGIPAGEAATVAQDGKIVVQLDNGVESVAASQNVYYRTAGTGIVGSFRTSADGGNTTQLTNARWTGSAQLIRGQLTYAAELKFDIV